MPSQGRLPGEKKPMKNENNIEMKEHAVSPVLLNHKAGALVGLIQTVTMLRICLYSTFWTQHKSYAASRFNIILIAGIRTLHNICIAAPVSPSCSLRSSPSESIFRANASLSPLSSLLVLLTTE